MHGRSALPLEPSSRTAVSAVSSAHGGERRLQRTALGLETHGVDRGIHAVPTRGQENGFGRVLVLVEVDGQHAVRGLGKLQPVLVVVHHENLLRTQEARRQGAHQPHRSRAEDRHRRARPDLCIDRRLVAGGKDVGQEKHLLVAQHLGHL